MIPLSRYYEVLVTMAKTDLKLKYQNSKIGMLWSLIKPLMQFFVYYTAFGIILRVSDSPDYSLRLFLGVLLWSFFAESTSNALMCYIGKKSIITKIRIEKKILPISSFLTACFNFGLTIIVFAIVYTFFFFNEIVNIHIENLGIAFLASVLYCWIMISFNIILASLNVLFRDLQTMWELALMYGVFLSPIMYHINIPEQYLGAYYFVNPVAFPIEAIRSFFFGIPKVGFSFIYIYPFIASVFLWGCLALIVDKQCKTKVADFI